MRSAMPRQVVPMKICYTWYTRWHYITGGASKARADVKSVHGSNDVSSTVNITITARVKTTLVTEESATMRTVIDWMGSENRYDQQCSCPSYINSVIEICLKMSYLDLSFRSTQKCLKVIL